jgi:hypothetical protein
MIYVLFTEHMYCKFHVLADTRIDGDISRGVNLDCEPAVNGTRLRLQAEMVTIYPAVILVHFDSSVTNTIYVIQRRHIAGDSCTHLLFSLF